MTRAKAPAATPLTGALARWVAVLAMLVQVVFFAEHLGASAVHGLGRAAPGDRLGFLQLCTGEGIALLDPVSGQIVAPGPQGPAHSAPAHSDCAVCSSASVCGFAPPAAPAAPVPLASLVTQTETAFAVSLPHVAPLARSGSIRAPPMA